MSDTDRGDDVYQPQPEEASDPAEQPDTEDTLTDSDLADALDEGYSPPDRPWAVEDVGTTASEQHDGESLDSRLSRERPEVAAGDSDGAGDLPGGEGEPWDDEVGTDRAGRLTQQADGTVPATLTANDVGVDGAAASAEEAAMHVVPDEEPWLPEWDPGTSSASGPESLDTDAGADTDFGTDTASGTAVGADPTARTG
ncbi:DUF5709 domain-containing protein [Streptomyces sp. AM 2-1-1]|uniref:DUF5709 domain-containing protein n=1 Tax=Streptomyces sp. AM 2-1-1 TaxID=3028709 RepID=UPI0023BA182F|nr:DUF5709 domain-containing protein [Streptomyces sp. AM 2-1-1]WEH38413.1 DUF5709 domain-containing protein [Streptomyces sp. AM 2-1-1]